MTLIYFAIAWLLGILAADLFHLAILPLAAVATLGAIAAALLGRAPRARLAALALCCAALGGARFDAAQVTTTPRSVWLLNDKGDATVEGLVVEDPRRTEDGQRALLASARARVAGKMRAVEWVVQIKRPPSRERR
jgi:predicted membrane metal-binding protein